MDAQEVCLALNISKRTLQSYREYGIIPCSFIGGKYMYKESDLVRVLTQKSKITYGWSNHKAVRRVHNDDEDT